MNHIPSALRRSYVSVALTAAIAAAAPLTALPAAAVTWTTLDGKAPLIVGRRGASGYLPEHTLEAYRLAIAMGADVIEPDLVSTKDGVLIARHEPMLGNTTNVSTIARFASRKRTSVIDGVSYTDWFASDFTLAEIKELRAVEQVGSRDQTFNSAFEIATLQDVIDLAKKESARIGRTIAIYPETKHPTWHNQQGLSLEAPLVQALRAAGWTTTRDPVIIQSFEIGNLKQLRTMTGVRLVQLLSCYDNDLTTGQCQYIPLDADSAPGDWIAVKDRRTYADMMTPAGLADIAKYANGVGPWKRQFIGVKALALDASGKPADFNGDGAVNEADGVTVKNSNLVADAHAAGLFVHPYTFRTDRVFARNYAGGGRGNAAAVNAEYRQMWALGVDGLFTDFTKDAVASRAMYAADQAEVIEYAVAGTGGDTRASTRYFRTAADADIAAVATSKTLARTNDTFVAWTSMQTGALATAPVCRYYDRTTARHLYSIDAARCASFASSGYSNEGTAFHAVATSGSACPTGTTPVFRHTRTTSGASDERLSAQQTLTDAAPAYSKSGIAFCAAK